MLVLSRKLDEAIQIGSGIRIKILHISDGQVKVGIEAPSDVKIYRAEIFSAVEAENIVAVRAGKDVAAKAAGLLSKTPPKARR